MTMSHGKVTVEIFGEKHVIRGGDNPEHIVQIAQEVDEKMRLIAAKSPRLALYQVAILAALNLADDLVKLREEQAELIRLFDRPEKTTNP